MNTTRLFTFPALMLLMASDSVLATADADNEGNVGLVLIIIVSILLALINHWLAHRACPVCHQEGTFRATGKEKHEAEYRCSACTHTEWQELKRDCK